MNKIYIITSGSYSDYCINHITQDKSKANKFCAVLNTRDKYGEYRVEEYPLDDFEVGDDIELWWLVKVYIYHPYGRDLKITDRTEKIQVVQGCEEKISVYTDMAVIEALMREPDIDKANKIALDRLAEWKAERDDITRGCRIWR